MIPRILNGVLLTLTALIVAFWVAWHSLALVNFAYPLAYDMLDIPQHINQYGPENTFKEGFETTDAAQHKILFAAIVDAIQRGGDGLADIQYQLPTGQQITLLTEAEVIHLQDVANLLGTFNTVSMFSLIIFIALIALLRLSRLKPPSVKQVSIGLVLLLGGYGGFIMLVGPVRYFYWLHVKIFPDDHQWFFYYQESLMTTLMKAPDLFGFIAALWIALALILFIVIQALLHRFKPR